VFRVLLLKCCGEMRGAVGGKPAVVVGRNFGLVLYRCDRGVLCGNDELYFSSATFVYRNRHGTVVVSA